jgi:hypothetical protein
MKSRFLLIPAILATASAFAYEQGGPVDAQAQAAALLSRPHSSAVVNAEGRSISPSPVSAAVDAHASAAALLSGLRPESQVVVSFPVAQPSAARVAADAHAQAAALLSGSRASTVSRLQANRTRSDGQTS